MARQTGLGRGLGALIPGDGEAPRAESGAVAYRELPVGAIDVNPFQPREHFDEAALSTLTASIREVGVLQPVLVRAKGPEEFELIAGERRWRAAKRAGLKTIPAIVRNIEDLTSLEHALVENLHRQDLDPLEEAAAFQQLMEDLNLASDPAKRSMILKEAQETIAADYVNGYLFQLARTGVAKAGLEGLWENAPTQANDLTGVSWAN